MKCEYCGYELSGNEKFCPSCGKDLEKAETRTVKKKWVIISAILAMVVICSCVGLVQYNKQVAEKKAQQETFQEQKKKEKKAKGKEKVKQEKEGKDNSFIFPNSNAEILSYEELNAVSRENLKTAINEIYARHGYIFEEKEVKEYFENQEWYTGSVSASDFSRDKFLNSIEKTNLHNMRFLAEKNDDFKDVSGVYEMWAPEIEVNIYKILYPDGVIVNFYAKDGYSYFFSEYVEKSKEGIEIHYPYSEYSGDPWENDYLTLEDNKIIMDDYIYEKVTDHIVDAGSFTSSTGSGATHVLDDGSGFVMQQDGSWSGQDYYEGDNEGVLGVTPPHKVKYFSYGKYLFEIDTLLEKIEDTSIIEMSGGVDTVLATLGAIRYSVNEDNSIELAGTGKEISEEEGIYKICTEPVSFNSDGEWGNTEQQNSESVINNETEARQYLDQYLEESGSYVPGRIVFQGMVEEGYYFHGYDDMGTHTATSFWYIISADGRIYDTILKEYVK